MDEYVRAVMLVGTCVAIVELVVLLARDWRLLWSREEDGELDKLLRHLEEDEQLNRLAAWFRAERECERQDAERERYRGEESLAEYKRLRRVAKRQAAEYEREWEDYRRRQARGEET